MTTLQIPEKPTSTAYGGATVKITKPWRLPWRLRLSILWRGTL